MIILESLILTCLAAILLTTAYTDIRTGFILNRHLLISAGVLLILNAVYYIFFAPEYFATHLINFLLLSLVSIIFYAYDLWAAGDSKLLVVTALGIPGRIFAFGGMGVFSGFVIVILVFSVAFLYVMAESFWLGIKRRDLFRLKHGQINYSRILSSYLAMVAINTCVSWVLNVIFGDIFENNQILSVAVSFLIVLTMMKLRERLSNKALWVAAICGWLWLLAFSAFGFVRFHFSIRLQSWLIVLFLMFLRAFAEKYNYQSIPTSKVKKGHILSAATVIQFQNSRVHGLPQSLTEDLRARLTEEEAESVRRWEHSAQGCDEVIIVRKIPFASFIAVGTVIYVVLILVLA